MFDNFVLSSKKNKAQEFLTAIKKELRVPFPDQDFLDYMWLAEQSPSHKTDAIHIVARDVVWPMLNGHYMIERIDNKPVAYASWGFFSDHVGKLKLEVHKEPLVREDYNSGPNIWLLDVIAPFGHSKLIISKLMKRKEELGYDKHTPIHFRRWYATRNLDRVSKVSC